MQHAPKGVVIQLDHDRLARNLVSLTKKHLPTAVAGTLNSVGFHIRRALIANVQKRFDLKSKFTERGIQVDRAQKTDPITSQVVTIGVAKDRDYLKHFLRRGSRTATKGGRRAIPQPALGKMRGRASRAAKSPSALLKKRGYYLNRKGTAILRRRKGVGIKAVYIFRKATRHKKRFELERTVQELAPKLFYRYFDSEWSRAIHKAGKGK